MYFTREAQIEPQEVEAARIGGAASATSAPEVANEYEPGVLARAFRGDSGEPPGSGATTLLRSPSLSSRSNAGIRVIALSRAQRTQGNRYTQRLVSQIQLNSKPSRVIQRECACGGTCSTCSSQTTQSLPFPTVEETSIVQRQSSGSVASQGSNGAGSNGNGGGVIPADSYGEPLDEKTRRLMEARLGTDFRDVRVHRDQRSAASAEALEANAYTAGRDIYFGAGKYAPTSQEGQHLLAHELTHVQQQAAGKTPLEAEGATDGHVLIGSPTDRLETEADKQADAVTRGEHASEPVTPDTSGAIQLNEWTLTDNPFTNTVASGARQGANLVTSGARQGYALVSSGVQQGAELVASGARQGAAFVLAQIEKLAPGAVAFFRNIRDYFKNAISKGVDGLFGGIIGKIREKGIAATLAEMIGSFASGVFTAVSGFVAGSCAAMGQLAQYFIDIHIKIYSGILDQVKKGFDVIRGTLEDAWTEYGAPAVDIIKKKLKSIWQDVEDTAGKIWNLLRPLREGAAWVWDQVTDLLVDGRRGFNEWLEWIIPKAIDEWEKIKAKMLPYMGYVKTAAKIIAAVVLLLSPAGPFIAAGLAIYGLYLGVKELWDKWGRGFTKNIREWYATKGLPWVQNQLQSLQAKVDAIKSAVTGVLQSLYNVFMQVLGALGVLTFLKSVKSAFDSVSAKVREFKDKLDQKLEQWSAKLRELLTKADPYLQKLKEAFRQSLLVGIFGPYAFLDDGVWNSINRFVALVMRTPCLREVGGLLHVPGFINRLGRLREGIKAAWEVIKNPDPLLNQLKEAIAPMVGNIEPGVRQRVSTIATSGGIQPSPSTVASITEGGPPTAQTTTPPVPTNAARPPTINQVTLTPEQIQAQKDREEYEERRRRAAEGSATGWQTEREIFIQLSVWHYLSASLAHLATHWWEELKKIGGELLWPWPTVAKEFVPMIENFSDAVSLIFDLEFSKVIDKFLEGMRKFNAIAGALSGWIMLALILIGAGLGALGFTFGPLGGATVAAGAGTGLALGAQIGMGLLVIALATEGAVLEKAEFDLLYQNPRMPEEQRYVADQEDAKAIAGSVMSIITIGALFLLAEIAAAFAKFFWSLIKDIPLVRDVASLLRDAKNKVGDFSVKKPAPGETPGGRGGPREAPGETGRPAERPAEAPGERPAERQAEPGERPAEPTERPGEPLPDETAAAAEKQGVPRERLQAEVGELNRKASNPDNVRRPSDSRFDAEMNAESHTFDRNKSDRTWCRFTDPACGLDLGGDLNAKVDAALEAKPVEAQRPGEVPGEPRPSEVPGEPRPGEVPGESRPGELPGDAGPGEVSAEPIPGEPVRTEPAAVPETPAPEPAPRTEPSVDPADVLSPDNVRRYNRYAKTKRKRGEQPKGPQEWYDDIGRKPGPNPHGKRGDPASEAEIARLADKARAEFPDGIIHQGTSIKKKTGINREPDVWVENAETGAVEKVYEAGKTNQDGSFVPRERAKKAEYDAAGIPNEFGNGGPMRKSRRKNKP